MHWLLTTHWIYKEPNEFTKKENGCKNFHPIDECKIQGCKQKNVPEDTLKSANLMMNADLEQFAPIPMLRSQ